MVDDFVNLNIDDLPESLNNNFQEDALRKIFVGGLSWMTTEDGLRHYIESLHLVVEKVTIMCDKTTGRSRGFGFVSLGSPVDVDKAVTSNLFLDGRKVEAKRAIPKRDMDNHAKKIFVGGIPISLSTQEFRKYFEKFGPVLETQVMTDRESGRSRGFGFVTYENEDVVEKVLKIIHTIHGKPVEVKRAEPKKQEPPQSPVHIMHVNQVPPGTVYVPHAYPYQGGVYAPQAVYGAPVAYDPAYFVPTQGGLVYLPQHYDDPEYFSKHPHAHLAHTHPAAYRVPDLYDPKYEGTPVAELVRNRKSQPTENRTSLSVKPAAVVQPRRLMYSSPSISLEPQETTFAPGVSYTRKIDPYSINLSAFSTVRLSEPRTERAFSTGFLPEGLAPIGGSEIYSAPRTKITTPSNLDPRKKRAGTQPPVTNVNRRVTSSPSAVVSRRTDLNWRGFSTPSERRAPGGEGGAIGGITHKYFQ